MNKLFRMVAYAARLNSFYSRPELFWPPDFGRITTADLLKRAASVGGLSAVDLNYPDHLDSISTTELKQALHANNLNLNGFAMRYYENPVFKAGAFAHADAAIREEAIQMTFEGIDKLVEAGGSLMTIWLGQDAFDYVFQMNYRKAWDDVLDGLSRVAAYNPDVSISIEYKPNEPRSFSLLPDIGMTLLAIKDIGSPNLGVTIDFCHSLYADEQPAFSAALVSKYCKLLGIHLNDGYAKRDNGLMVASVHPFQTLELLYYVKQSNYDGVIYFDTFPESVDPVKECETNIAMTNHLLALLEQIDQQQLAHIMEKQDAVEAQRLLKRVFLSS